MTADKANMCSHLQKKLFEEDGVYHRLWMAMQDDPFFRICNHERSKDMQKYQKYKKRDKRYSRLILKEGSCR